MGPYDLTMKRLASAFLGDYVRFALGKAPSYAEVMEVQEVDKELPALMRQVDFAARVEVEQMQLILLMEFQTRWEVDVPQRMVGYTWRLFERYRLPVFPVLVVLRRGGVLGDRLKIQLLGKEILSFWYRVIPVWELEARAVMEEGLTGVYPLLPLMRVGGEKRRGGIGGERAAGIGEDRGSGVSSGCVCGIAGVEWDTVSIGVGRSDHTKE